MMVRDFYTYPGFPCFHINSGLLPAFVKPALSTRGRLHKSFSELNPDLLQIILAVELSIKRILINPIKSTVDKGVIFS